MATTPVLGHISAWLFLALGWFSLPALASQDTSRPEREIVAAFKYPKLEMVAPKRIEIDLIVKNNGRKDETVLVDFEQVPQGCAARLSEYGTVVGGVFVAAGERKTLRVSITPGAPSGDKAPTASFAEGDYPIRARASTSDGSLNATAEATVTVRTREGVEGETKDPVDVACSYPTLRGANDSDFKFSIDINNNTDEEDMASLRADAPRGWEVAFKPSYESKYIGSVKIDANLGKSVDVEVTPPPRAEIGTYPITVFAKLSKHDIEARRDLSVELTGRYKIKCGTLNDLLSLTARGGRPATVSLYVANRGTAAQKDISFTSFKPENWKIEFEPEKIESIEPGGMQQVEVKITPAVDALVGDYSVELDINGEKARDTLELRVTIRAATTWAWIGAGIILLVVAGLTVLFKVLGRR